MAEQPLRLVFIDSVSFEDGKAIRGAILVTDDLTRPLEFRCTSPIRPTKLQTILYGQSLESHILCELVGLPLFRAITGGARIVIIRKKQLLLLRPRIEAPVVWLGTHGESEVPSGGSDGGDSPLITSTSGKFEPVIVSGPPEYASETQEARKKLQEIFERNDLMEPFERMRIALEQVHKEKVGEK